MAKNIAVLILAVLVFILGARAIFFEDAALINRIAVLEGENQLLKQRYVQLSKLPIATTSPKSPYELKEIRVFSSYPLNVRRTLTLAAGSDDGIRVNMPVTVASHTLIGRVTEVSRHYSVVQTIYDPEWSMPVAIAEDSKPGLFVGGPAPEVQMVEKEGRVSPGDLIVSSGDRFPFGLFVGRVKGVSGNPSEAFQNVVVDFEYDLARQKTLTVITDFIIDEDNIEK